MDDLISRKAAIDAIMDADVCVTWNGVISDDDAVDIAIKSTKGSVISSIVNMPSAQPETHDKRTKTHVCDCISRKAAMELVKDVCDAIMSGCESRYDPETEDEVYTDIREVDAILKCNKEVRIALRNMPSAQPETHEERTETHACDCISRQAAIDAHYEYCNKHPDAGFPVWSLKILEDLPSAQPELCEGAVSRQRLLSDLKELIAAWEKYPVMAEQIKGVEAAIGYVESIPSVQPEHTNSWYINSWCVDCKEYDTENKCCPRYNRVIKQTLDDAYRHGETEAEARFHAQQRWIPCSERLPENGHYYLWCSDMGSVQSDYYWDGFENGMKYGYNIVAWMPLPEPYAERRTDERTD